MLANRYPALIFEVPFFDEIVTGNGLLSIMTKPLRLEFEGALYHITSRGDRRENIYETDEDRQVFLSLLDANKDLTLNTLN